MLKQYHINKCDCDQGEIPSYSGKQQPVNSFWGQMQISYMTFAMGHATTDLNISELFTLSFNKY